MDFRIILLRQKQKHKKKKFFSQNTPPGLVSILFHPEKNTKSIVYLSGERSAGKASTPGKNNEPRTGGEAVVSTKKGCCKKSLCKMTNKINKKISQNPLTILCLCAIIQIQRERDRPQPLTPRGDNYYVRLGLRD